MEEINPLQGYALYLLLFTFLKLMIMTLYAFNTFRQQIQYQILWDLGVYVMSRKEGVFKYLLYQIESFYVELTYDSEDNCIIAIRTFSNVSPLESYLNEMDVTI